MYDFEVISVKQNIYNDITIHNFMFMKKYYKLISL